MDLQRKATMNFTLATRLAASAICVLVFSNSARSQELQWAKNPANNHWYGTTISGPTSWMSAETLAVQKGGHLATIKALAENTWISQAFAGYGATSFWIGINDIALEGTFVWSSGQPVTFTNWQPGQPDNSGGVDDAGTISPGNSWKWFDNNPATTNISWPLVELTQLPQVGWTLPVALSTANVPQYSAMADLDNNGSLDVVVPNFGSASISTYLGLGGGVFAAPTVQPTSTSPYSIAIADLDGDGNLDIAVACFDIQQIRVYIGDGAGGLIGEYDLNLPSRPRALVTADFDGDGRSDLAVTTSTPQERLFVIRSLGAGNFTAPVAYATGTTPNFLTAGDLDSDGDIDLVVTNSGSNDLGIFVNTGAGSFTSSALFPRGTNPGHVAIQDFNGDGKADLAVPNQNDNNVRILLGDGAGAFTLTATLPTGGSPIWATICDLDGDGRLDFATANFGGDNISLFHSHGDGTFDAPQKLFVGDGPLCLASADVDGDGHADLISTTSLSNKLVVIGKLSRDCNGNGVDDPNDISGGASPDCNANGIPDECDLAQGSTFDCNANGAIDSCEITQNALLDLNGDGILDQCQLAGTPYCFGDGTGAICPCDPGQAGALGRGCMNSQGGSGKLEAVGNASVSLDSVSLRTSGLLPIATGLFFQGNLQQNGGLGSAFGDGLLCVNQAIRRLAIKLASGGAMSFGRDNPGDGKVSVAGAIPVTGATRYYQVWYRDAFPFCTPMGYNLTNGVRIVWMP